MSSDAYTTLGVVQATLGRKNDAIDTWKRAVDLDPTQFNALYNLWSELAAAGRRDEAIRYGRRFVSTAPPVFFAADIAQALFDMSNSMTRHHAAVRSAADALIDALWPGDRVRLGSFGIEVALSPLLTNDARVLHRIVDEELWPGGPTPLWAATYQAMTSLAEEHGRRVVLLLTDGDDSGHLRRLSW